MLAPLMHSARSWGNALLAFVYPEVCCLCGSARAAPAEGYVCRSCTEKVQAVQPPFCARCGLPHSGAITTEYVCGNCDGLELHFSTARSAVQAKGPALDAIHAYKYNRALWLEPYLFRLFTEAARPHILITDWDFVVPVPLHPLKLREREYNQAERLAKALARSTGIPLNARCIRRIAATRTQTRLTRTERRENIRNAFEPTGKPSLAGKRVVLVDDVFTTGATTNECARILRRAGAADVCVWTLARGI